MISCRVLIEVDPILRPPERNTRLTKPTKKCGRCSRPRTDEFGRLMSLFIVWNLPMDGRSLHRPKTSLVFLLHLTVTLYRKQRTKKKNVLLSLRYSNSFSNPAGSMTCWTRYFFFFFACLLVYCVRLSRWLTLFTHFPPGFRKSSDSVFCLCMRPNIDHKFQRKRKPAGKNLCHTKRCICNNSSIAFKCCKEH